ncbi:MAG: hypothetical protein SRB2_02130 [Desulfobacteraceae bacterium Eth-SRB2]|nr:MAG: hypothetical protein SRB2_02130 [Desulfobacteraceae bacterium Eth-SRB2]
MHMKFLMNNITLTTGVTRNQLKQWLKMGILTPSIRCASGPGTRNVFSREDLYLIAVFRHFISDLFYREPAADYLKAINPDHVNLLVAVATWERITYLQQDLLIELTQDKTIEESLKLIGKAPNPHKIRLLRESMIRSLYEKLDTNLGLFLAFLRIKVEKRNHINCLPVIEGGPAWIPAARFKDLIALSQTADDTFILNFGKIMREIDIQLMLHYPEKMNYQYKKMMKRFRELPSVEPNKIKIEDLLKITASNYEEKEND